jgi:hypothetical protein
MRIARIGKPSGPFEITLLHDAGTDTNTMLCNHDNAGAKAHSIIALTASR